MADYHDMMELCPLSGVGRPPSEWSHCNTQCGWSDPETCECAAIRIVTMLQDLPLEYFNTLSAFNEAESAASADEPCDTARHPYQYD